MNYRKTALSLSSAALLSLSIVVPFLGWLIWIAFVPFLLAIRKWTPAKSFFSGLFTGTIFFAVILYWINRYEFRIFAIVITLISTFFGMFGWLAHRLWQKFENQLLQMLVPPIAL